MASSPLGSVWLRLGSSTARLSMRLGPSTRFDYRLMYYLDKRTLSDISLTLYCNDVLSVVIHAKIDAPLCSQSETVLKRKSLHLITASFPWA